MARTKKTTTAPVTEIKAAVAETTTKKTAAPKKAAAPRAKKTVSVNLQFGGQEFTTDSLVEEAVANWTTVTGNAKTAAKDIQLYVKPEENTVYYVINGETGSYTL